ncbi:MAG: PEP-CTERM sorting domain-containing protein [Gemmataceae bacterium]
MSSKYTARALMLAAAAGIFCASNARADLQVRITVFDSGGASLGTNTGTLAGNPQGAGSISTSLAAGGFVVVAATGLSSGSGGILQQSTTVNYNYTGPTGATSNRLVIEFVGTNYNAPVGGVLTSSDGSLSSGTATTPANAVTMVSGISTTNQTLAVIGATPGVPTGLAASSVTNGSGTVTGVASLLTPNPSTNGPTTTAALYSFYQAANFASFSGTGTGGGVFTSTLTPVPEPATIVSALVGLGGLGLAKLRRRKTTVAA